MTNDDGEEARGQKREEGLERRETERCQREEFCCCVAVFVCGKYVRETLSIKKERLGKEGGNNVW